MTRKKRNPYGGARGGWSNLVRGKDVIYVSFYCRGTVQHAHEKWRIGSVYADVHEGEIYWAESTSGYADHERDQLFRVFPRIGQYLDDTTYVAPDDASRAESYNAPDFRIAWQLRCAQCGFSKKIAQPRTAYPVLQVLAQMREPDNIVEVPVREFSRRVEHLAE